MIKKIRIGAQMWEVIIASASDLGNSPHFEEGLAPPDLAIHRDMMGDILVGTNEDMNQTETLGTCCFPLHRIYLNGDRSRSNVLQTLLLGMANVLAGQLGCRDAPPSTAALIASCVLDIADVVRSW